MWGSDSWSGGEAAIPLAMAGANVWATPQTQYNVRPSSIRSNASNPRLVSFTESGGGDAERAGYRYTVTPRRRGL
jgi:hypothetical protein